MTSGAVWGGNDSGRSGNTSGNGSFQSPYFSNRE